MNHEKNNQTFKKDIDASIKTNTENSNDTENIVDDSLFEVLDKETYNAIDFREVVMFSGSIEDYLDSLLIASQEEEEEQMNPIVKETLEILDNLGYRYNGIKVRFPDFYDYSAVEVLSPQTGSELLREDMSSYPKQSHCSYSVTNQVSFEAASKFEYPMVMNFANAYAPGGGFVGGSIAQEECLCRNSTLYNSISSEKASEMYQYNIDTNKPMVTDYMLYSPNVCVFRDKNGDLMKRPFLVAVTTAPAPNRMREAMFEKDEAVNGTIKRRIRILLRNAIKHGHDSVVLGAWGCGVFGNEPKDVATCFRDVLVKEGYDKHLKNVNFAIFGKENSENILGFKEVFAKELGLNLSEIKAIAMENALQTQQKKQSYRKNTKNVKADKSVSQNNSNKSVNNGGKLVGNRKRKYNRKPTNVNLEYDGR